MASNWLKHALRFCVNPRNIVKGEGLPCPPRGVRLWRTKGWMMVDRICIALE